MKIISRDELMQMPAGTIYAEYASCSFGGLSIKADTLGPDFICAPIFSLEADSDVEMFDRIIDMLKGKEYPAEIAYARDGMFEQEQKYVVFSKNDLTLMLGAIQEGISVAEEVE